ncbi:CRISPR-associated endonuclease Cas2 [Athalassotoga sp.]|uniref:CRISPR-associated endoribonuclease Cas2 n=1 Tax=Caldisericum exile TaxID=693075 RepID=A0A2J6X7U9_9BACT|nr:MAG: CRISPR-associated endonuclease Cas2 [Caldisericum exile]HEU23488.1 CRISPR-associated endonuclease Cas2 [Mesoaciditoga lauensis]
MYVIMVYDIEEKRVGKILKIGREYLTWIQNSVFEGEITAAKFRELKSKIKGKIEEEKDSVLFFKLKTKELFDKEVIGTEKNPLANGTSYTI